MKVKRKVFLFGAAVLTTLLFTDCFPVVAAPPGGEVKIVAPMYGNEVPIPFFESSHAKNWMQLFYDPLVGCTPDGKFSPDIGLANRWEMTPDGLTWTFYLRKGVKFHDGVELTAKDVKFSMEQVLLPNATSINAGLIRRAVKAVEARDPYTVVFHCKKASLFLPNLLSNMEATDGMIIPKDYYERLGKDGFARRPIGSGPYKWHSQQVGSFIKLEAADKHWRDGVPRYKYMTYLIIPEESTRMAMLRTGEADISRISREAVKEARTAGLNVMTKDSGYVVTLVPHMQWATPAFSDIRFRKALNLAIDKEAIIGHLLAGVAKPLASYPGSNIFAVGGDTSLKPYPYAPQEAKRLIKEGGWDGYEFVLVSYPRAGCPEFPRVVETLAGYWQKIGLKPKILMTEYGSWRKLWDEGKTQNQIFGFDGVLSPSLDTFLPKFQDRWYAKNKRSTVNVPEINERFDKIGRSLDRSEVSRLLAEIWRWAYDQYAAIPICEIPYKIATTKRISPWDPGRRRNDLNYLGLIGQ